MMLMILILIGALLIAYDWSSVFITPATLFRTIFSLGHVFSVLGAYLIFEGFHKKKHGKYWFSGLKKNIKISALSVISAGLLMCAIQTFFIFTPDVVKLDEEADYVIILGGGIDKNGKLPKTVRKRLKKACEYLELHPETICVVSGGTLKQVPHPEAPAMKRTLIEYGIADDRILVEDKALDTIQNLQKSCLLLAKTQNKKTNEILDSNVVIVTSITHLARAERLAKRIGFTSIKGIKASIPLYNMLGTLFMENCSYLKLNLRILFTGKPVSMRE